MEGVISPLPSFYFRPFQCLYFFTFPFLTSGWGRTSGAGVGGEGAIEMLWEL
jgi:hypothetical protein